MTENEPGFFSRYRDHYRATRPEHRPVPVLYPFLAIAALVVVAFVFLDPLAGAGYGHWPDWLARGAAEITDVGKSWWILTLATVVIVGGWAVRRLSASENAGLIAAGLIARASYILCSVGLAALIVNTVKRAIGRPRPDMFADHGLFSFNPFTWNFDFESFPSGHATVDGALFMALALMFPRFRWPLLILGLCFALTRVVVGAHYPSDVAAGFGFGMWFAFATALFFARIGVLFETTDGRLVAKWGPP
jgi:undecaprenyl-diphosphatase